jgi:hypothetical protein
VIKAECATPRRRDTGSCPELHKRMFVVGSEQCSLLLDGERSQT